MTVVWAFCWLALTTVFCALAQLMLRFDGWLRDHGFGFLMIGDREFSSRWVRVLQGLILALGLFGFVTILTT